MIIHPKWLQYFVSSKVSSVQEFENFLLSPQLSYFRSEDSQESMLLIPVGNVTADTELTYEYGSRTKKNRPSVKGSTGGYGMFIYIILDIG